jgi:hypothetical protein
LTVTLVNASSADVDEPSEVLTAVFFYSPQVFELMSPIAAMVNSGSIVYDLSTSPATDVTPQGGNVGGEWAYGRTEVTPPTAPNHGISSSGFDVFGGSNFPGENLYGPEAVNGVSYGITSLGDDLSTGNGGVQLPLIKNAVVFSFGGFTALASSITEVRFQYGTGLEEPSIVVEAEPSETPPAIPEPATFAVWSILAALGIGMRFRRRNAA